MRQHSAFWTYDSEVRAYYFAPTSRRPSPYRRQIEATVVLDIADDGSLAGIELLAPATVCPPQKGRPRQPMKGIER